MCVFFVNFWSLFTLSKIYGTSSPAVTPTWPARHTTGFQRDFPWAALTRSEFNTAHSCAEWHIYSEDGRDVTHVTSQQHALLTLWALTSPFSLLLRTGFFQEKKKKKKSCLRARRGGGSETQSKCTAWHQGKREQPIGSGLTPSLPSSQPISYITDTREENSLPREGYRMESVEQYQHWKDFHLQFTSRKAAREVS